MEDSYHDDQQHTSQKYPLGKTRVLVVDDHELTQDVVKAMLEHINCDVCVATSGKEAIEIVQQRLFDIVFMDCVMPGMDGFETTRIIRELEAQPAGLFHRYLASLDEPCDPATSDEDPRQRPYENSRETTEGINAKKHTTVCHTPRNLATSDEHPIPQKSYENSRRIMLVAGKNTRSVPRDLATSDEHPIPGSPMKITEEPHGLAGKNTRSVPIIAFTAGILDVEKFLDAGMDDLLTKPVYLSQLEDKLRQWG